MADIDAGFQIMPLKKLKDVCRIIRGSGVFGMDIHSFLFCQDGSRFAMAHYTDMNKIHNLGISGPEAHRLLVNHTRDLDRDPRNPYVGHTLGTLIQHTTTLTSADALKMMDVIPRARRAHYVWNRNKDKRAKCAGYRYISKALEDVCLSSGPSSTVEYSPSISSQSSSSAPTIPGGIQNPASSQSRDESGSTTPIYPAALGSDVHCGGNDTSSSLHAQVQSVFYIPPWPVRVHGRLCNNEPSGRDEAYPPAIDTQSHSSIHVYSLVTKNEAGEGLIDEINSDGKIIDVLNASNDATAYGSHISDSENGSNMSPADHRNVASTSAEHSAINDAALAGLDRQRLPVNEKVNLWLTGVEMAQPSLKERVRDRRRRKRRGESVWPRSQGAEPEGGSGKRRKV